MTWHQCSALCISVRCLFVSACHDTWHVLQDGYSERKCTLLLSREAHAAVVRQRAAEVDRLRLLRMRSTVQCCACMGEYQECLAPLMAEGIVDVVLHLLADWRLQAVELVDVLRLLCSLLAHRRCGRSRFC